MLIKNPFNLLPYSLFLAGIVVVVMALTGLSPDNGKKPEQKVAFKPYNEPIPGSDSEIAMVPIEGGTFQMGSPESAPNHEEDEGPQHKVKVDGFWMGKYEISWKQFELFVFEDMMEDPMATSTDENPLGVPIDAVSKPTPPYTDMSFGMGKEGYPAICMTQYAALSYCRWLTAKTGHFYRLPTEAEWEYACRAGTTTAYSFGDDPAKLDEYAWHYGNSPDGYGKIGKKKPNPWGLYDMHGNVAEWTLDQYIPDYYEQFADQKIVKNPWAKATELYPRVVRGGSWFQDPEELRSANRMKSKPQWKMHDPQIPKSNWWHTAARHVGFRIIRPKEQPTKAEIEAYFQEPIKDL